MSRDHPVINKNGCSACPVSGYCFVKQSLVARRLDKTIWPFDPRRNGWKNAFSAIHVTDHKLPEVKCLRQH
jgi:hypothetical protein